MELTSEQKQIVATWVHDGLGLSEVQNRIQDEFSISMTYMDVRFLLDDLELDLKDPKADKKDDAPKEQASPADTVEDLEPVGGEVRVEIDAVQRPGALVSGSVVFSDGEKAGWQVDQMGRLGIIPTKEGYRPPEEDMQAFQVKLQEALQSKGM